MNHELTFHPAAEEELLAAENWYAERSLVAARAFAQEAALVVDHVGTAPERWPRHIHGTRRLVFPRFPYTVIYRVKRDEVQVVAVAHQSRRPAYWKNRL